MLAAFGHTHIISNSMCVLALINFMYLNLNFIICFSLKNQDQKTNNNQYSFLKKSILDKPRKMQIPNGLKHKTLKWEAKSFITDYLIYRKRSLTLFEKKFFDSSFDHSSWRFPYHLSKQQELLNCIDYIKNLLPAATPAPIITIAYE